VAPQEFTEGNAMTAIVCIVHCEVNFTSNGKERLHKISYVVDTNYCECIKEGDNITQHSFLFWQISTTWQTKKQFNPVQLIQRKTFFLNQSVMIIFFLKPPYLDNKTFVK
jgi:hypothetical protein